MRDRSTRLLRIACALDTMKTGAEARIASLRRQEQSIQAVERRLVAMTADPYSDFQTLLASAGRRLAGLAIEQRTLAHLIEAEQRKRSDAHRKSEIAARIADRLRRASAQCEERRILEETGSALARKTASGKPAD